MESRTVPGEQGLREKGVRSKRCQREVRGQAPPHAAQGLPTTRGLHICPVTHLCISQEKCEVESKEGGGKKARQKRSIRIGKSLMEEGEGSQETKEREREANKRRTDPALVLPIPSGDENA